MFVFIDHVAVWNKKELFVMKKAFILIVVFWVTNMSIVSAETLSITGAVWCPNNCYPSKDRPGIMLEISQAALEIQGYDLTYTELPWSRALNETRAGNYDAIIGAAIHDSSDFIYPEEAVAVTQNCFFVRKESTWKYAGLSSLSQIFLGIGQDETVSKEIDTYIEKHINTDRVQVISGLDYMERNFRMLKTGRVSAIIADINVVNYLIREYGESYMFTNAGCLDNQLVYLAFSPKCKNAEKFIRIFDEGVKKIRHSGKFQHILDKYDAKTW